MPTEKRLQRIQEVQNNRQSDIVLVLEDVWDPHNAEAIFRSCDAFGIQSIYLLFQDQEPYDPLAQGRRSSASAHKWLDFHIFHSSVEGIDHLKSQGFTCLATSLKETSDSIYDTQLFDPSVSDKLAIFLGNESKGLSQIALEKCDYSIQIPMRGMVQSLNVSVTAGILLFEYTRRRCLK